MRNTLTILSVAGMITLACSCRSTIQEGSSGDNITASPQVTAVGSARYMPKAVLYQTNGDYNNNVTVTLSADGKQLIGYPDPKDVGVNSAPIQLDGGWLLDRRGGIGNRTAFLRYTYAEYAALSKAPSPAQIIESVIPGACVTRYAVLPITAIQAVDDPESVNIYVKRLMER